MKPGASLYILSACALAALAPDISYRIGHHPDITEPPSIQVHEYTEGQVWDDGSVRITLRDPDEQVDLQPGESWGPVRPGRPHLVTNSGGGSATFLVLQGIGDWDHIPLA